MIWLYLKQISVCEQVKLDHGSWKPCNLTGQKTPLYTAPWQPELYAEGLHVLEVRAIDFSGAEIHTELDFALDNTKPNFPLMARIALMWDFTTVVSTESVYLTLIFNECFITIFRVKCYSGLPSCVVQFHSASYAPYRVE